MSQCIYILFISNCYITNVCPLYIKRHEFRSVKIFKKIREHNEDLQKEVNDREAQVIGKMITFSEDCKKVIHDTII